MPVQEPHYLLVGEAPPPGTVRTPWHRQFAARLICRALDVPPRRGIGKRLRDAGDDHARARTRLLTRFVSSCEHVNLLKRWPGYKGRGSAFPMETARRRADAIKRMPGRGTVLLAGRRVARAFGFEHLLDGDLGYFEPFLRPDLGCRPVCYIIVPHPSGVNRWWNHPVNREKARLFFELLGQRAPARQGSAGLL